MTLIPHAFAHEVYVLTPNEVKEATSLPSPNPLFALKDESTLFLISGAIGLVLIIAIFAISASKLFERVFDPLLYKLKKWAPLVARITLGVSLFASGYFHASFGPELPLSNLTEHSGLVAVLLMVIGALIIAGFLTRAAAMVGVLFFLWLLGKYHLYMLNYLNYLGELVLVLIVSGWKRFERYSFLVARICFGVSLIFASFYAKFLHANLALATVYSYHLTNYFHFTPLFLTLGAFLVEATIGLCFILGFEIRFVALVFTFFLTLSILFFGEAVWPHIILFGLNLTFFCHGYDRYTLQKFLLRHAEPAEPVL